MSTDLGLFDGIQVTQFAGGVNRGICIQLTNTRNGEFIQLTRSQASEISIVLGRWILGLPLKDSVP